MQKLPAADQICRPESSYPAANVPTQDVDTLVSEQAQRIAAVQEAIARAARAAGRDAREITLLAVSKKQSADRVLAAYNAGLRDFGENYLQGLQEHEALLPGGARWHFIGHIQSKKAKHLAHVALVHSLDSLKVASKLDAGAKIIGRVVPALINVNISQQESKSGVAPDELVAVLGAVASLKNLEVRGLMCIPSPDEEPRRAFARLRQLRDSAQQITGRALPELSMGMSGDFADAIAEGSTIIRIGTAIFGPRNET